MAQETNRRSFLSWVIFALGAVFSAVIGVPILCYAVDPRHRKGASSNLKLAEGIKLDELRKDSPRQGVLRDTRVDGWTLYPNDVIGRVWVVQVGDQAPDLSTEAKIAQFNAQSMADKQKYLMVFTTICPHLGCSVNLNSANDGFACPCHAATFNIDGQRVAHDNPAARGMDALDWTVDEQDNTRLLVKYQSFEPSKPTKVAIG